jgi:predicted transcriptional regulator
MDKPIYTAVIEALNSRKGEWRQISEGSDVPYSTLCKIAQGHTESPSVHVVQKLYDYLCKPADKRAAA